MCAVARRAEEDRSYSRFALVERRRAVSVVARRRECIVRVLRCSDLRVQPRMALQHGELVKVLTPLALCVRPRLARRVENCEPTCA